MQWDIEQGPRDYASLYTRVERGDLILILLHSKPVSGEQGGTYIRSSFGGKPPLFAFPVKES